MIVVVDLVYNVEEHRIYNRNKFIAIEQLSEAKGGMQELFDNKFQKKTKSNYELNLCRRWESNSRPPNGMKMGGKVE